MKKTRIAQHLSALTARETDWIPNEYPAPKPWDGKFTDASHTPDDSVDILEFVWSTVGDPRARHGSCAKEESGHDV